MTEPTHRDFTAELNDPATTLTSQECAVVLSHAEADAVLAMLEKANNAGIVPGIGLRVEHVQSAGFRLVGERFRDEDPYNRADRIRAVIWSRPPARDPGGEDG